MTPKMLSVVLLLAASALTAGNSIAERQSELKELDGCHFHDKTQYCMSGDKEYRIVPESEFTDTAAAPTAYVDCHSHGADTYCMLPDGKGEVQVVDPEAVVTGGDSAAGKEADGENCHFHAGVEHCLKAGESENGGSPSGGGGEPHCHFHAGVEHCVAPGESEGGGSTGGSGPSSPACERKDRDYKIGIRVGMLFATLAASAVGVFGPIFMSRFMSIKANLPLIVLKQFGTGVIISTAFAHLYTHASMMFGNPCLTGIKYEATTSALVMAGLFISFVIEFCVSRALRWQAHKKPDGGEADRSPAAVAKAETANVTIMEAGIVFHSILIGVTTVVAGDSYYATLAIVIIFHQLFEGIALGTRIAALGYNSTFTKLTLHTDMHAHNGPAPEVDRAQPCAVSLLRKLIMATGFAVITPIGMGIGIGVLKTFNGNDPSTIIAIGTLDSLSAGILVWVGVVEMLAHDWMLGGDVTNANALTTGLAMFGLVAGMVLMSFLGKWA